MQILMERITAKMRYRAAIGARLEEGMEVRRTLQPEIARLEERMEVRQAPQSEIARLE
ncbi:hypothetical protein [Paenibacillus contaminans]|uniref:hypothetical protein n=1 Tax=Paenibacillus contaminans TaxID=450362 RepID=UPI001314B5E6|nr:hypothetical protein [Paenibacillus contaminans]